MGEKQALIQVNLFMATKSPWGCNKIYSKSVLIEYTPNLFYSDTQLQIPLILQLQYFRASPARESSLFLSPNLQFCGRTTILLYMYMQNFTIDCTFILWWTASHSRAARNYQGNITAAKLWHFASTHVAWCRNVKTKQKIYSFVCKWTI